MRSLARVVFVVSAVSFGCGPPAEDAEEPTQFVTIEREPQPNELAREDAAAGWIRLFDGESLFGWTQSGDAWHVADGALVCDAPQPALLATTTRFADYELRWEAWIDAATDAGIELRAASADSGAAGGYEVQLCDRDETYPTGSLVGRTPAQRRAPTAGAWRSYSAVIQGRDIVVHADGEELAAYSDPAEDAPAIGRIALHAGAGPCKLRSVYLKPLGLQPLFNDQDLAGWHNAPGRPAQFEAVVRARQSRIYTHQGGAYLETDETFGDFIFQAEVIFNGQGYDGGIWFRAQDAGADAVQGYEVELNNAVRPDDRSQPAAFGTGGLAGLAPARVQVPSDLEWFTPTIVADGPHIAVWIDGIHVTDWTDTRPPSDDPREGLRTAAGHIGLAADSEEIDLFLTNLRVARLPVAAE